jgi:ribonuclease HI
VIEVQLFTDGAVKGNGKASGRIGAAAVLSQISGECVYREKEVVLGLDMSPATNNYAELLAIKIGIEAILPEHRSQVDLLIRTDSQWALKAITAQYRNLRYHLVLIREIRVLLEGFGRWKFHWVKGHDGNELNERCDRLASNACRGKS